ncbi:MAG: hypothetical protein ABL894_09270 [Hyphomicrobium sp.]
MAKASYQPPEQSALGQVIDSLFLLLLVFGALFAPIWLGLAAGAKTVTEFADKTWKALGQNETMQAAWEKLGQTPETAAAMIGSRFDYTFDPIALAVTALVVIAYFYIVVHFSKIEYREVIDERFGDK